MCRVVGDELVEITAQVPTVSELAEQPHRVEELGRGSGPKWSIEEVMKGSGSGDPGVPHFLAPIDLQVTKACGVTFVGSLIERVIEEKGGGDIAKADALRKELSDVLGGSLKGDRQVQTQLKKPKKS